MVRIALIMGRAFLEFVPRQLAHQLRENRLSVVHKFIVEDGESHGEFQIEKTIRVHRFIYVLVAALLKDLAEH